MKKKENGKKSFMNVQMINFFTLHISFHLITKCRHKCIVFKLLFCAILCPFFVCARYYIVNVS